MSTRRCSTCAINYPVSGHDACDRCGGQTDFLMAEQPHEDWLDRAQEYELMSSPLVHADAKTRHWRWGQFVLLGFSPADAETLAPRRDAELRDIERWLSEGATHEQVLRIVAPLDLDRAEEHPVQAETHPATPPVGGEAVGA